MSWNAESDEILRKTLEYGNGERSWAEVAKDAFPDGQYTKKACMERWKVLSKPKPLRGPWTKDEDAKLEALVANYGSEKWVVIATEMATRSGKQCRERWHNHLDPRINKGEWTVEEDELIHQLYSQIGSRWAEMAKHLPGRPDNAIKNYWNASLIRQKRRRGDSISSLTATLEISDSPIMTRSNSITSPRYSPYVIGGAAMTKSRSEQQFTSPRPVTQRRGSVDAFQSPSQAAAYSPLAKPRSQKFTSPLPYSPPVTRRQTERPISVVAPRNLNEDVFDQHASNMQPTGYRFTPPTTPERSPSARPFPLSANVKFPYAYSSPPSPPLSATYQTSSLQDAFAKPSWTGDVLTPDSFNFQLVQLAEQDFHQEFQPYSYANLEQQYHYLDDKYPIASHASSEQLYQSHSLAYSDSTQTSYSSSHESNDSLHPSLYTSPHLQGAPYIHPDHAFQYTQNAHWGRVDPEFPSLDDGSVISEGLEMYLNPYSDETIGRSTSPTLPFTYISSSPVESLSTSYLKRDTESPTLDASFSPSRMGLRSPNSKLAAPISLSLPPQLASVDEHAYEGLMIINGRAILPGSAPIQLE